MYPHERSLVARHEGRPFVVLGINSDADPESAKQAAVRHKLSKRSWWDGGDDKPIARQWNVDSWPTIYVLDARGGPGRAARRRPRRTMPP